MGGMLSIAEFNEHLQHLHVRAYFRRLGLEVSDAKSMFKLLDFDDDGEIDMEEFILGFTHLRGDAKRVDVAKLRQQNRKLLNAMTHLTELVIESYRHLIAKSAQGGIQG